MQAPKMEVVDQSNTDVPIKMEVVDQSNIDVPLKMEELDHSNIDDPIKSEIRNVVTESAKFKLSLNEKSIKKAALLLIDLNVQLMNTPLPLSQQEKYVLFVISTVLDLFVSSSPQALISSWSLQLLSELSSKYTSEIPSKLKPVVAILGQLGDDITDVQSALIERLLETLELKGLTNVLPYVRVLAHNTPIVRNTITDLLRKSKL